MNGLSRPPPDSGHGRDLLDARRAQPFHRAERAQQRLTSQLTKAGDVIKRADRHRLRAPLPVVGDREPVRLIANALQEIERLARARQDQRIGAVREPYLFQPLRQAAQRDIRDAELAHRGGSRCDLWWAAVDDHKLRRVGELLRLAGDGVDRLRSLVRVQIAVELAGLYPLLEVSPKTSVDDFVDAAYVVLSLHPSDGEPAVLTLACQSVFEDDHRR